MRTSRRSITLAALAAVSALAIAAPASANHTTVAWEGQNWRISDNATALVDGDGALVISRTVTLADANASVTDLLPTTGGSSYVNANGTPWVKVTYEDNADWRGVDFFIDSNSLPGRARLQAGSLFNCEGLGYVRYGLPAVEQFAFTEPAGCEPSPEPGTAGPFREAGEVHTIYVGQRADGTVDYNYDGQWFTSTFLRDNTGPFPFSDVFLRLRANEGNSARFLAFEAGDDHPGAPTSTDACKKGAWETLTMPSFKNQGDCMSYVVTAGQH
jgi:hypothetical protein